MSVNDQTDSKLSSSNPQNHCVQFRFAGGIGQHRHSRRNAYSVNGAPSAGVRA